MADTDPLIDVDWRTLIETCFEDEAGPSWEEPIFYRRGVRPPMAFQCARHGDTVVSGAAEGCEQCMAMLGRDPACMTGDERADEMRYWCEQVRFTIGHSFVWKRIDALAGRPTGIDEPALAAEELIEEARRTRRLNSLDEAVSDVRFIGQFEVLADDHEVLAWGAGPLTPRHGGSHVKLDPDDLPNGLYLVRFTTGDRCGETVRCQLTRSHHDWTLEFI